MNEAERGKKAIFDQDSNPCCPWEPTKKIYQKVSKSPNKKLSRGESRTAEKGYRGIHIYHPYP